MARPINFDIIDFHRCGQDKHFVLKAPGHGKHNYFAMDVKGSSLVLYGLKWDQGDKKEFEGRIVRNLFNGGDPEDGYLWERATLKYLVAAEKEGRPDGYYYVLVSFGQDDVRIVKLKNAAIPKPKPRKLPPGW
jgi:hypothetical protein